MQLFQQNIIECNKIILDQKKQFLQYSIPKNGEDLKFLDLQLQLNEIALLYMQKLKKVFGGQNIFNQKHPLIQNSLINLYFPTNFFQSPQKSCNESKDITVYSQSDIKSKGDKVKGHCISKNLINLWLSKLSSQTKKFVNGWSDHPTYQVFKFPFSDQYIDIDSIPALACFNLFENFIQIPQDIVDNITTDNVITEPNETTVFSIIPIQNNVFCTALHNDRTMIINIKWVNNKNIHCKMNIVIDIDKWIIKSQILSFGDFIAAEFKWKQKRMEIINYSDFRFDTKYEILNVIDNFYLFNRAQPVIVSNNYQDNYLLYPLYDGNNIVAVFRHKEDMKMEIKMEIKIPKNHIELKDYKNLENQNYQIDAYFSDGVFQYYKIFDESGKLKFQFEVSLITFFFEFTIFASNENPKFKLITDTNGKEQYVFSYYADKYMQTKTSVDIINDTWIYKSYYKSGELKREKRIKSGNCEMFKYYDRHSNIIHSSCIHDAENFDKKMAKNINFIRSYDQKVIAKLRKVFDDFNENYANGFIHRPLKK